MSKIERENFKILKSVLNTPAKFKEVSHEKKACFSYAYKQYGEFETWDIAMNILGGIPPNTRLCNELILENTPVKPYLDIEWLKSKYPELDCDELKLDIKNGLKTIFKDEWGVKLNTRDILFASCHRKYNDTFKFSFHVIVNSNPQIIFENTNCASIIASKLRGLKEFSSHPDIIDIGVYSKTQNFRIVGHCKQGELESPFKIENEGVPVLDYLVTNIDYINENFTILEIEEQTDTTHKNIKNVKEIKIDDHDYYDCRDEIEERVKTLHPTAFCTGVKRNFITFNYTDRTEPCFTDKKKNKHHDHIGFFVFISEKDNCVYAGCFSGNCNNENNKKIIENLGHIKKTTPVVFEKVDISNKFDISPHIVKNCIYSQAYGLAQLFGEMYLKPKRIKWINNSSAGNTFIWNGKFWEEDTCFAMESLITSTIVRVLKEFIKTSQNDDNFENTPDDTAFVIKQANRFINDLNNARMTPSILKFIRPALNDIHFSKIKDIHPNMLSCKNGMVDLVNGNLRDAIPSDNITKFIDVEYVPDADSSIFENFVRQITSNESGSQPEIYDHLKWLIGYSLQGNPKKKIFIILYGEHGFNGKSLLMNTISDILDYYAVTMDKSVVLESQKKTAGSHSTEICQLENCRFGILSDTKENSVIDDGQVKQLTGITDKLSVREIFGKQKEFRPMFVPWIGSNHPVTVNLADKAMKERLVIFPFELSFVDEPSESFERHNDAGLADKFKNNKQGILKWLIDASIYYNNFPDKPLPRILKDAKEIYNRKVNPHCGFLDKYFIRYEPGCPEYNEKRFSRTQLFDMFDEYKRENHIRNIKKSKSELEFDKMLEGFKEGSKKMYKGLEAIDDDFED